MPGPFTYGDLARGLRDAIFTPIANDFRQGNRSLQATLPIPYQLAQMHPVVGIPTAAMNYADAMDNNDSNKAAAAALSGIPIIERGYRLGKAATSAPAFVADVNRAAQSYGGGLRGWMNVIGRRAAAGEQVAEFGEAGYATGEQMRK